MPMSNRAVVERFIEIINSHDFDRFGEVITAGYIQHAHGDQGLPGLIAFFEGQLKAMPDLKGELELLVDGGPMVAAKTKVTGTKDGKPTTTSIADFWRVEDGKLAEHW